MSKVVLSLLIFLSTILLFSFRSETQSTSLNLGFEKIENNRPINWNDLESDEYIISIDTSISQNGKNSAVIENYKSTVDCRARAYGPPANYQGKRIKPSGYLKTGKDKEFDEGSDIYFGEINQELISNLELMGKIWGFLKYHHPAIAKGKYNWDYELFRILPKYIKQKDNSKRDSILSEWIDSLGEIRICKKCKETPDDAVLKPDLNWINESDLSESIQQKLQFIYKNRNQGKNYYVSLKENAGNPDFSNEKAYSDMPYPDDGFRLLSLYRYWNIVHYFYPNRHLMDKNWNSVLKEYIPVFLSAGNELEYELAAIRIIGDIQDTHANILGDNNTIQDWKGKYYAPVHLRFIEDKLVVMDYYNPELKETCGLQIGDVITSINGNLVEDILKEKQPYYPASNYPTQLRDISADMLRSNSNETQITYRRNNEEIHKKLQLYEKDSLNIYRWYPRNDSSLCYKLLEGNIGYITLKNISILFIIFVYYLAKV
jgi:hypothetical protein